ncbi:type VI secretion system baseplate subunit TssF [Photobacterium frigidiphilum]|uniref:type VI secretion system baseplate subunit TssF n=1 Tax=Photobacterium frigidiphilum TaxID=264736 RepID=UPI003D0A4630
MSDSLLQYFEQELSFIRGEATQFADRHPSSARALGITKDGVDDPQITRLIESVALLNGRLQKRLDESFPELTDSLIRLLFPHYLRPVPSYSVLNFDVTSDASATHSIPAGTEFEIGDTSNKALFRTTKDVDLFPVEIETVKVAFAPFETVKPAGAEQAKALIEITISAIDEGIDISLLAMESLNLTLKGESSFALKLYDLLVHGTSQVCIRTQKSTHILGKQSIQPIGFDVDDTILPYQAASFGGFKLLTEFFVFSDRFNGFTVQLNQALKDCVSNRFTLQIYVDELSVDVARSLSTEHFSLFSTPIVNLHHMVADPVEIDFLQKDYPIVLDATQVQDLELFSIDEVIDVTTSDLVTIPQIYGEKYSGSQSGLRWQLVQKLHESGELESALKVADLEHSSLKNEKQTWLVNATVTNGSRVGSLPINSSVECMESITIPAEMSLLRRPSLPIRSKDSSTNVWSLLCHLHFNYHAILGSDDPKSTLKNVFELYNHNHSSQNQLYIESLVAIDQEQVVAPIRVSGRTCFAYGTKITVTLDPTNVNGGITMFSHLLDHFFAFFAGFNSFTQVDIKFEGQDALYIAFPRRTGCKSLL